MVDVSEIMYRLGKLICQHSILCKLEFEIFKIAFGAVLFCLQPGYLLSESMGKCSSWAELPCTPYSEPTPITGGQCRCDRTLLSISTADAQQNHTNTKHDFPEKNNSDTNKINFFMYRIHPVLRSDFKKLGPCLATHCHSPVCKICDMQFTYYFSI